MRCATRSSVSSVINKNAAQLNYFRIPDICCVHWNRCTAMLVFIFISSSAHYSVACCLALNVFFLRRFVAISMKCGNVRFNENAHAKQVRPIIEQKFFLVASMRNAMMAVDSISCNIANTSTSSTIAFDRIFIFYSHHPAGHFCARLSVFEQTGSWLGLIIDSICDKHLWHKSNHSHRLLLSMSIKCIYELSSTSAI